MKITKHAQSCFLVESDDSKILIDPGVYVTEKEGYNLAEFSDVDAVVISHEHSDHFSSENLDIIIQNNPAVKIYATKTVKELFGKKNTTIFNDGDVVLVKDVHLTGVKSIHGPLPNGMEPPEVIGVMIDDVKTTFYDPSDTVELYKNADVVAVPICGVVVMDIEKAKAEAVRVAPKYVIPIHYDSPSFPVEVEDFVKSMEDTGLKVKALGNGDCLEA